MTLETCVDVTDEVKLIHIPKKDILIKKGKELKVILKEKGKLITILGKISGIYRAKGKGDDFMYIKKSGEPLLDVYNKLTGRITYSDFAAEARFTIFGAVDAKYI
jgi:hypothetical protein